MQQWVMGVEWTWEQLLLEAHLYYFRDEKMVAQGFHDVVKVDPFEASIHHRLCETSALD